MRGAAFGTKAGFFPLGFCFAICPVAFMVTVCHTGASLPLLQPGEKKKGAWVAVGVA